MTAAIASYGRSAYERVPTKPTPWHLAEALRACVARAGLRPEDIDGLAVSSLTLAPDTVVTFAEEVGLELSWAWQGAAGGASGVAGLIAAKDAIEAGRASAVACVAGDALTPSTHRALVQRFHSVFTHWLHPLGFGGPTGIFALVQRRHMEAYGTAREQLASVAISQRENAAGNPDALLREPLTLREYLEAPPVVEPLGLYDCVLPCAGAEAILVVDPRRIELDRPQVEVAAGAERHNFGAELAPLSYGWSLFVDALMAEAGVTRDDVDLLQLYDDYPIMVAIQLEEFGFCGRGESGAFVAATDTRWSGELPVNTGGGQLSMGQCGAGGGLLGAVEAVQQLCEEANGRQVPGARVALVTGLGMIGYGRALSCTAVVLKAMSG